MRAIFIISGIIVVLIAGVLLCGRIFSQRQLQEIKPFVTYSRLVGVASDCDKYKAQYGAWPNSIEQLIAFRPELIDWAKDGWGRYVVLVPYDKSLGYGKVISYGRDGKPGGSGADCDLEVRFPTEANASWNKQQGVGLKQPRMPP
jgi:hypothetical protein